jgi:hypothetical protein
MSAPLLVATGLRKTFRTGARHVAALDDVAIELA